MYFVTIPLIYQIWFALKHSAVSNTLQRITFHPHVFYTKWHRIVSEIKKKPETLDQIRDMVVKPVETVDYDSDESRYGVCPVDSDPE